MSLKEWSQEFEKIGSPSRVLSGDCAAMKLSLSGRQRLIREK
jgi:hypothetical protein